MKKKRLGREMIAGLKDALEYERGARKLRATTLEIPAPAPRWRKERIAQLRRQIFRVSQPVFAALLSVNVATLRAWEQGRKSPSGAACRLLELAAFEPGVFQRLARAK